MKKLIVMSISLALCMALSGCNADKLQLEKSYTVELGNKISTASIDYLAKDSDKEVIKDTIISFIKDKAYKADIKTKALVPLTGTYLPVGKYKASAKYKKEKKDFIVEIKDTTAPKFINFNKEVVIEENAQNVDITKYFKAEDLSVASITVDKAKLDLSKAGTYEIKVTATDKYKNKVTKKVTVKIISMDEAEKDGVTPTVEGTKPQSKALEEKIALAKQQEEDKRQKEKEQQAFPQTNTNPTNNGTQLPNESASPTGNAVANAARSFVGNRGFFLGEWSCINTVDKALTAAGVDSAPMINVYDNCGNGGYEVSSLQVGDVVMYYSTSGIYHCAVYIGNGLAVHGGYNPTPNENGYMQVTVQIDSYNAGAGSGVKFFRFW